MPKADSPAINAGDPAYVLGERRDGPRGQTRISESRIDIGAVEILPTCWATKDDGTSVFSSEDAGAVQAATDSASAGGTVKVAGNCVGVASNTVNLYVNKNLTVLGGFAPAHWVTPDPANQPTTLDTNLAGRAAYITSGHTVTLRYLNLTAAAPALKTTAP